MSAECIVFLVTFHTAATAFTLFLPSSPSLQATQPVSACRAVCSQGVVKSPTTVSHLLTLQSLLHAALAPSEPSGHAEA